MYIFEHQLRVRYAETDQMGYVYYGNYAAFYEVARTEMLRNTGITYKELEEMQIMMPVIALQCTYVQAATYDELLTIKTTIKEKPTVRIKFEYEIFNESNVLLHTALTELVFVDMKMNKPCRPPVIFQEKMSAYFK